MRKLFFKTKTLVHSRHGLEYALYPVSQGELVYDLLVALLEVDLPGVLAVGLGELHVAAVLKGEKVFDHFVAKDTIIII